MKTALYILVSFLILSCSTDDKSKLIGEWYRLDEWINTGEIDSIPRGFSSPRPPIYYPFGYDFFTNDSVEYFQGVWEKTENKTEYLGQYRKYEIKRDSLFIYSSDKTPFRTYKIEFLNNDTVRFCNNENCLTFVRFESTIKNYIKIDSIRISHMDGWGKNVEYKVTSNRDVLYVNTSSHYEEDLIIRKKGKISEYEFNQIELKYNKANFLNLTDYSGCCDGDDYTIEIFYNGNKNKLIYDYMNSSPMLFIWANRFLMTKIETELGI